MKRFKKLVVLDKIILSELQWKSLGTLAEEVIEFSGLNPKQLAAKLAEEQGVDPGAVCFTALAVEEITEKTLNERLFWCECGYIVLDKSTRFCFESQSSD